MGHHGPTPGWCRRLPAAALLLLPIQGALVLAAEGERVIPSRMCGDYFLVSLALEGREDRSLVMLFDTGASHTVVDPDALERVAARRFGVGRQVTLKDAVLGPMTFRRLPVRLRELDHIARALRHQMDGILGFSAFRDLLLILDYPAREMRFASGRLPEADGREILDLSRRERRRPWIQVRAAGQPLDVLVDSGSGSGLLLPPAARFRWRSPPRVAAASMRIRGVDLREAGRLAQDVRFGATTLREPVVELTDDTPLMGQAILRQFVLTFDQRSRRIRLERDGADPIRLPAVRGTGALLTVDEEGTRIIRVLPGSPAARAGLKAGERVLALAGTPVEDWPCGQNLSRLAGNLEQVQLILANGSESRTVDVPLVEIVP